jgi:SAM-dependent methyltransferase
MAFDWFKEKNPIVRYHRTMIDLYGTDSSLSLGWREPEDQLLRFRVLAEIGDFNGRTVLDAGCGYADLYPFLKESYPNLGHYYGVEQVPEMLKLANKRFGHLPDVTLLKGDFVQPALPVCDYVLTSGSLNYGQDIFPAIKALYQLCTIGFGFNLLREISGRGMLKAYDPQEILLFARQLDAKVVLRDDYSREDFTLFLYRKA